MRKLPETELDVMMVLWNSPDQMKTPEIVEALKEKNWSVSTIQALLARLEEKGFIEKHMEGRIKRYKVLISRQSYSKMETESFVERFYQNSVSSLVANLVKTSHISDAELDEIRKIIDDAKRRL